MRTRLLLASIRRCGLAKFFATTLVLLVASPLTAPFSTFDPAEVLGETSLHLDAGGTKLVEDAISLASIVAHVPPAVTDASGHLIRGVDAPAIQHARPLALRI